MKKRQVGRTAHPNTLSPKVTRTERKSLANPANADSTASKEGRPPSQAFPAATNAKVALRRFSPVSSRPVSWQKLC
jgi:hypothetical protein